MPLAFKADESTAAGIFQFFSARDPDRFEPRALFFEKSKTGWLWSPEPSAETEEAYEVWVATESRKWQDQWQQLLLGEASRKTESTLWLHPPGKTLNSWWKNG